VKPPILYCSDFNPIGALVLLLAFSLNTLGQSPEKIEEKILKSFGLKKAEAFNEAVYFYANSNPTKALEFAQQSLFFAAQEPDDTSIRAYALFNKGIYFYAIGSVDSATSNIKAAHETVGKENTSLFIKTGAALGKSYISVGEPQKGLEVLFETLRLLKKYPEIVIEQKVRTNIMWAYLELKRYRDCIQFGRNSLILVVPETEWLLPYFCNNIAASYGALMNLDSARYFAEMGIPYAEKSKDYGMMANAYFIIGNAYASNQSYSEALIQFEKAKPYREKTGNVFYRVADLYVIADLYHKNGEYAKGIETGIEALHLAKKNKLTLKLEGVYQVLARNYEALNDFRNATIFYRKLAAIKDTVYQQANTQAIAEMQTRFETEKKELQLTEQQLKLDQNKWLIAFLLIAVFLVLIIVFFWRSRTLLKQKAMLTQKQREYQKQLTESVIELQEMERSRFAKDLHDGLGQLISSVRLYVNQSQESWSNQASQLLDQMHTEIRNIAFALLPQSLVTEGIGSCLQELALRINQTGKISVYIKSDKLLRLETKIEISLYRVCQEWITNIIKYAEAKTIHVNLIHHDTCISLTIEDNGKGFDPGILQAGQGIGWRNIQSRVQVHHGSVYVESTPGKEGATLIIEIPKSSYTQLKVA
jgi:two-component system, NarL family, sensor kinase